LDIETTPRRGVDFFAWGLRRDGIILGGILMLFLGVGIGLELAPAFLQRPAPPDSAFSNRPDFEDPNLMVPPSATALEVLPGKLTLGTLANLLNSSKNDLLAGAFHKAFMSQPQLRKAVRNYLADRDTAALRDALMRSQALAALFSGFSRVDGFNAVVRRAAGGPLANRPAAPRAAGVLSPSAAGGGSLGMVRMGDGMRRAFDRGGGAGGASGFADSGPAYAASSGSGFSGASQPGNAPGESISLSASGGNGQGLSASGGSKGSAGTNGATKPTNPASAEACMQIANACAATANACAGSPLQCATAVTNCVSTSVQCGDE